jgi:Na+/phosphate symporter
VLGAYILDSAAFTLSFEIAALFLLAVGIVLWTRRTALRLIGASGMLVGLVLFATGLISTASIQSSSSQIGFMVFSLWTLVVGIYFLIRPAPTTRDA